MYDYNGGSFNQTNMMDQQQQQQNVPNVMMDDTQSYAAQAPLEAVQTTATINGITTTTLPMMMPGTDAEVLQYDIPDETMRRAFVRKMFMILILQYLCAIPIMEIFIFSCEEPVNVSVYASYITLILIIYAVMYAFSEFRRYSPMNIVGFVFVTLLQAVQQGIGATYAGGQMALFPPLVIISQLLILIAYSKQARFKFSNINGMALMLLIYIIASLIFRIFMPDTFEDSSITGVVSACYFIYDTHLLMTGFHGYNLNSEELLFAVTNIYADFPNLFWRQIRYVFNGFMAKLHFLKNCFFAEVC